MAIDQEKLAQLEQGVLVQAIELGFGADQFLSYSFGLTSTPTAWTVQRGHHNNLTGYWIYRTNTSQCWQAVNTRGPLRFWNADGKARGNPEDWELFVFEIVDAPRGGVRVRNVHGAYVRLSGANFTCDAGQSDAATLFVEFD